MSQGDNKSKSSNNASDDSSDNEEVMIKQESNYEGQGDHDAIEEENKDQDFYIIQNLSSGIKGKALLSQKILQRLLRETINLEFQGNNYFQKR